MPYDEFIKWMRYFDQRPVGWRDDFRFASVMRNFGDKRRPEQIFPSLNNILNPPKASGHFVPSLLKSNFFNKMMSAKGGAKLEIQ